MSHLNWIPFVVFNHTRMRTEALTRGGPRITPLHRVRVMSSSSSKPQLTVPSPTPFWPSSSSSRSRKLRGTLTPVKWGEHGAQSEIQRDLKDREASCSAASWWTGSAGGSSTQWTPTHLRDAATASGLCSQTLWWCCPAHCFQLDAANDQRVHFKPH